MKTQKTNARFHLIMNEHNFFFVQEIIIRYLLTKNIALIPTRLKNTVFWVTYFRFCFLSITERVIEILPIVGGGVAVAGLCSKLSTCLKTYIYINGEQNWYTGQRKNQKYCQEIQYLFLFI